MKDKEHSALRSSNIQRLIDSFAADMIHGVTRGKTITAKHFLLPLGLHNLTGSKKIVEINNRLGHCLNYNVTCEIETSQAKKVQLLAECSSILRSLSKHDGNIWDGIHVRQIVMRMPRNGDSPYERRPSEISNSKT